MTRRLLSVAALGFFCFSRIAFATFYVNTQWEVRTTGSDDNGGGFAFGRTNIEAVLLDLVIDGSNNKIITSATHNFVAGDVGKYILLISTSPAGWILGWYRIVSTASNAATLHESPGAVGLTGGDGNLYYGIGRSQQDAAEQGYTDLLIGTPNTTATSAARAFGGIDEGNIINVLSGAGCTVQRVQITSVAGVIATFDKALGTIGSTCTGNLGGALLTLNTMATLAITSNEVYIKAGTYTTTTNLNLQTRGVALYGYQTSRGDNGTKPLITTATDSIALFNACGSGITCSFNNLSLSNTAAVRASGIYSKQGILTITNSLFDGFTNAISAGLPEGSSAMERLVVVGTEIKNSSAYGIGYQATGADDTFIVVDSYIHDNTTAGIFSRSRGQFNLVRNRITDNGIGILSDHGLSTFHMTNNTVANNTTDGFQVSSSVQQMWVLSNNIFYGNGGWGLNISYNHVSGSLFTPLLNTNNAYGLNTSGNHRFIGVGANEVTLTADPFTNAAGGDFTLNSDAGGGALCKATGTPAYLDIGALQSQGAVAGAHGSAFVQ